MQREIVFEVSSIDQNGVPQYGPQKERTHPAIIIYRIAMAVFALYVFSSGV